MMDPNLISTMDASGESVVDKLGEDLVPDMFRESEGNPSSCLRFDDDGNERTLFG
jgi:hypothetical protein